jgi:hypothetical protein
MGYMTTSALAHIYWSLRGTRCHLRRGRIVLVFPNKPRSTYTTVHDVTPYKAVIVNKMCKVILNLKVSGWYKLQIRDFETIIMIRRNLILQLYDRRWGNVIRVRKKDCKVALVKKSQYRTSHTSHETAGRPAWPSAVRRDTRRHTDGIL